MWGIRRAWRITRGTSQLARAQKKSANREESKMKMSERYYVSFSGRDFNIGLGTYDKSRSRFLARSSTAR